MKKKSNPTIAIVITGLAFGGAERVTSYLANHFVEHDRKVHVISLTKGERAYPILPEIQITEFDVSDMYSPGRRYLKLIKLIRMKIKEIKPSIVLGMMSYSGGLASIACLGLGIPFIISERNNPYTSYGFTNNEKRVLRWVYRNLVTKAIFQSEAASSFYYKSIDPRGVVIPNPLFLNTMPNPRKRIESVSKFVSAGRLNEQKNHDLLIRAFSCVVEAHPFCQLTIYGEGEEREALEALVKELGLEDSVALPGIAEQIFPVLLEADVFVLSSDYEGMPNALIEAMAMGLACVTTDYSGGRGTVIKDGHTGLVVSAGDVDALAKAMMRLVEDISTTNSFAERAVTIRQSLDSEIVSQRWLEVITQTEKEYYESKQDIKDR
jgi:glycosyltransferase involved in cell wall biosynthesis